MAFMDLCTPHIILSQFTDTQSYIKVMGKMIIFQPVEVIYFNYTFIFLNFCKTNS